MQRHSTFLVPLDGSVESESALPYAKLLAEACGGSLELLRSFEPISTAYGLPALKDLASDILAEDRLESLVKEYLELKRAELEGIPCEIRVECGHPADCIVKRSEQADLVVMCRHGRSGAGRWLLGGTTAKVARGSSKPVLVVPPGPREAATPALKSFLVCLDGSSFAAKALEVAAQIAAPLGARLTLYRAVPLMGSQNAEGELIEAKEDVARWQIAYRDLVDGVRVQPTAVNDHIPECAQELGVDLVVVGSHGRRGLARWLLGSVAEHTLNHITVPVLIVHNP